MKTEVLIIPFQISATQFSLLVVLQDGNIERMKAKDPGEIPVHELMAKMAPLTLRDVILAHATAAEAKQLLKDSLLGVKIGAAFHKLFCGWQYRPDLGDNDKGPVRIGRAGQG